MEYVDMKSILDRNEVSHNDMDKMWDEARASNPVVQNLADNGKNWTDLPPHLLDDLVKKYEKYL